MLRKLWMVMVVALVSLVLLAQAAPGLASITLLGGDNNKLTWTFSYIDGANNLFEAGYPNIYYNFSFPGWYLTTLNNQTAAVLPTDDASTAASITFNTLYQSNNYIYNIDPNNPTIPTRFAVWDVDKNNNFQPLIASTDFQVTVTATFNKTNGLTAGSISGVGTDYLHNNAGFTLTGTLIPIITRTEDRGHNIIDPSNPYIPHWIPNVVVIANQGYFTDLQLQSAATPIPGAVWLLGTGLLGLAWARRRRRA